MIQKTEIKKIFAVVCLSAVFLVSYGADEKKSSPSAFYKSRMLGDTAFNDEDFNAAVIFYRRFKVDASKSPEDLKTASKCLISAYIRAGFLNMAQKELDKFTQKFKGEDPNAVSLFKADILLGKGHIKNAEQIYRKLSLNTSPGNELYPASLSGLGFCLMRQKRWNDATKTFSTLRDKAVETKWKHTGLKGLIYCLIMNGSVEKASEELKAVTDKDFPKNEDFNILKLMLKTADGKLQEIPEEYDKLRTPLEPAPYPLFYMANIFLARTFSEKKQYDEAVKYLKEAFLFAPTAEDRKYSMRTLINTYASAEKYAKALSAAKRFIRYYGNNGADTDVKLRIANLYLLTNEPGKALECCLKIINNKKNPPGAVMRAVRSAARIYIQNKEYEKAGELFDSLLSSASRKIREEALFLKTELSYLREQYPEAIKEFNKIINEPLNQWRRKAAFRLMLAYIKTNNLQEAMKISNSLKEEFPESEEAAEALYYQGIILFKQNRKQDASEKFTKFASDFPSNPITPDALFRKGEILITLKKKAEAIETFSEIISKYPESSAAPAALYRIFICEYILGNVEKARTAIDSLTQNYPDSKFSVSALFWLADNCRVAREYTEATAILKKIREKYRNSPENVSKALYDEAWIKNLTGNYAEALTLLKELNEKYSDSSINVEGLFLAGDALSAQGKYEEASDYYNKAAKRRPESTLAMAAEGRAADCAFSMYSKTFKKEYIQQAVESYKKILGDKKISPDTRNQTLFKLGKCYETIEMKRKALEKFKELIYLYKTETENGQKVDKIWAVKAATEAVAIYMRENIPEAAAEAVKIYKNLMKINIDQALEYEKNIKKIKEKFKI